MIDIHSQEDTPESDSPWDDIDQANHDRDVREGELRQEDFADD